MIIQITDLNITQATPSVISEGGVQQSRPDQPGELGLRSRREWSETVCIKCLFFDDEMCPLQKVGGEDSKGRIVL